VLVSPPNSFEGRLSTFLDRFVAPNFPPANQLVAWTQALLAYHADSAEPVCVVRGQQRGLLRKDAGERVVDSDNSPGIWAYLRCRDGAVSPLELKAVLDGGEPPLAMAISREERLAWNYGCSLSRTDASALWDHHLKHCHIFPARPRVEHLTPRQRALRNVCPLNHLLFPMPTVFEMQGDGIGVVDLGENNVVIGWVLHRLIDHLAGRRDILYEFARLVRGLIPARLPHDPVIQIHKKSQPSAGPDPPTVMRTSNPPGIKPTGTMRRWTLNARHGFYVSTGITDTAIDVALSYKRLDDSVEAVGNFQLDLEALTVGGVVKRRNVNERTVYDVRIVRDDDGSYWLTVRSGTRLPLR